MAQPFKNNLAIRIKGCKNVHSLLYIIIPFLGIFPKGNKAKSRKDFGLKMFIAVIKRQKEKDRQRRREGWREGGSKRGREKGKEEESQI